MAEYDALLDKADAITDDVNKRYDAYADAEAWLLDNVLQIPIYASDSTPSVTKVQPFTAGFSYTGLSPRSFKYRKVGTEAVKTADWEKAYEAWEARRTSEK